jgi:outer membrane lipoprotein-sorting protein
MGFWVSRRARWAVPGIALAATGAVMAGSLISVAQAAPALPSRTPAQLLAQVAQSQPPPLSGTVVETASLGLPSLPHTGNPTSIASLLTGSHTIHVWYAGHEHYRLAVPESLSESDVVRDGGTVWLWQSTKNAVTEFSLPANADTNANANANASVPGPSAPVQLTPQQAAQQVLAKVGPTTTVGVDRNVMVAGQASYELVLAPKDSRSLIGQVRIAIDGSKGVPLRVQVFARGASSPAISIGYTAIHYGVPPASDTSFTPPPGATVTKVDLRGGHPGGREPGPGGATIGSGWLTVVELPSSAVTSGDQASGQNADVLRALLASAQSVRGTWGSGQLLHTSLVSVLMTSDGRTFIGAVQPSVLYAAVAHR